MLEIGKLIPRLVSSYDFELFPLDSEWTVQTNIFAKQEFACMVKQRNRLACES